jgi:hypothetical protein
LELEERERGLGRERQRSFMRRSSMSWQGDDAVEGFGPDDEGAFVTLGNEVVSII